MKPYTITPEGEKAFTRPKNGTNFGLEEMYELLGCNLAEIVRLDDDMIMVVDEEGKLREDPQVNMVASMVAVICGAIPTNDCICGKVLVCEDRMVK